MASFISYVSLSEGKFVATIVFHEMGKRGIFLAKKLRLSTYGWEGDKTAQQDTEFHLYVGTHIFFWGNMFTIVHLWHPPIKHEQTWGNIWFVSRRTCVFVFWRKKIYGETPGILLRHRILSGISETKNQTNATGPTPCYFFTQVDMGLSENSVPQKTQWFWIIIPTKYPY